MKLVKTGRWIYVDITILYVLLYIMDNYVE